MVIQLLQILPEKYSVGFDDLIAVLLRVLVLVDVREDDPAVYGDFGLP
jgi:hypothetical protein